MAFALPVKSMGGDHDIPELTSIGTGIHPQAATNAAWNANQEFQAGKAGFRRIACDLGIKCAGLGGDDAAFMADCRQTVGQADHDTSDAAITNQKIRSRADC